MFEEHLYMDTVYKQMANFLFKCENFFIKFYVLTIPICAWSLSHFQLFATPWTVAGQAPLSTGIL